MQRHARLHGYSLLFAELQGAHSRGAHLPAFSLLACARRKRVVLAVRGTQVRLRIATVPGSRFGSSHRHRGLALVIFFATQRPLSTLPYPLSCTAYSLARPISLPPLPLPGLPLPTTWP
jgi:hypothetical protein